MVEPKAVESKYYTVDELQDNIQKLSNADLLRLKAIAARYVGNHELTAEDLIQEAVCRVLSGDRETCPRGVKFITFISGVVRSIAGDERRNVNRPTHCDDEVWSKISDGRESIESITIRKETEKKIWEKIETILQGDNEALLMLFYQQEGYLAKEIRREENIGKTQYSTILRRMRRKIVKHFPKGGA